MVFHDEGTAANYNFTEIDSLEFNMNFETGYMSRDQAMAVEL